MRTRTAYRVSFECLQKLVRMYDFAMNRLGQQKGEKNDFFPCMYNIVSNIIIQYTYNNRTLRSALMLLKLDSSAIVR